MYENMLILTNKGYKEIKYIDCTEKALTEKGEFTEITEFNIENEELYELNTDGTGTICLSGNDSILVKKQGSSDYKFKKVKEIDDSYYIGVPLFDIEISPKVENIVDNIDDNFSISMEDKPLAYDIGYTVMSRLKLPIRIFDENGKTVIESNNSNDIEFDSLNIWYKVNSINKRNDKETSFSLRIKHDKPYIVNGVIVHSYL